MNMMNCVWCIIGSPIAQKLVPGVTAARNDTMSQRRSGRGNRAESTSRPQALACQQCVANHSDLQLLQGGRSGLLYRSLLKWKTEGREGTQASRTGSST
jgi:hypothetical protein